jgi:hypothetical protein
MMAVRFHGADWGPDISFQFTALTCAGQAPGVVQKENGCGIIDIEGTKAIRNCVCAYEKVHFKADVCG